MAGFFKKLFNRITGKKDELAPVEVEAPALPAPEPEEPSSPLVGEGEPSRAREAPGGGSVESAAPVDFPVPAPAAPPSPITGEGEAKQPPKPGKAKTPALYSQKTPPLPQGESTPESEAAAAHFWMAKEEPPK